MVVFAYSEVGYVCTEALLSMGADILAVFTHEDDPAEEIWFRSVADLAEKNNIPVFTDSPKNHIDFIRELSPDMIFSFYYRRLIPMEIIDGVRGGAYNVHGGLLPTYRGRAPVNWAIIRGETESGVTLHHMTDKADCGDIVDQEVVEIGFDDTVRDLYAGIADASRRIMLRNYPLIASDSAPRRRQDESAASSFGKRTPADGLIDWHRTSMEIYNLIRGTTHPFPGAFSFLGSTGEKVWIWSARPLKGASARGNEPGTVTSIVPLCIATGDGLLKVDRIQVEGHPEQNDREFVREFAARVGMEFKQRNGGSPNE